MVNQDAWNRSREIHLHKLRKYREQKDYQIFVEEDEEDIEGEQVYSSIKNLHSERFHLPSFYDDLDHDATATRANMEQLEGVRAVEEVLQTSSKPFMDDTFGVTRGQGKR